MQNFTAHRLHFTTTVQTLIELNEHQGSAIRGALFHALRHKFCSFARDRDATCATCALVATCPVATLVSTLEHNHHRGRDRPRPYTIQPPRGGEGHWVERADGRGFFHYEPGETLTFGLTLYADALALFPYVVLATADFETGGLGRRTKHADGRWRRGKLCIREIWAENPLTGERQPVIREGSHQVQVPDVPILHAQILTRARECAEAGYQLTVHFLTPTRLVDHGHLLKPDTCTFRPLLQRLLERLEALSETFSDTPLDVDFPMLLRAAESVTVVENILHWDEVRSYSTRRHAKSPISGLVGRVTLLAPDWTPFLPWLLWGQFVHVGKSSVKGNGWYAIEWRRENGE